ncbi:MAG: excinuclease ABC subunit UvrA [Bacteroidales bacterium]|jgi:excinuclease ABC subunit A|nr:excinuclease ABC subunit UvrA [Bacteroidales bacterium]
MANVKNSGGLDGVGDSSLSGNSGNILRVFGARVHNLKNIDAEIPRGTLTVITGLSGSGKSSLAFDTIYAEGQRRYMETFSAYARSFIGNMERPDVDKIEGLSPVIAIEQKTTNKNPRSTVGTITEIYDYLRLLYARIGEAYSYVTGEKMIRYTEEQMLEMLEQEYDGKEIMLLAPLVKGRKGHYRELFEDIRKQGFLKVRVDGEIEEITFGMHLDRYKIHDIELVIDKFVVRAEKDTSDDVRSGNSRVNNSNSRLKQSVKQALKRGENSILVIERQTGNVRYYSKNLMCPTSFMSYPEPEPNTFSFNSPYGACPHCNGLGTITSIDIEKIIPNRKISIAGGGIAPVQPKNKNSWKEEHTGSSYLLHQIKKIAEKFNFDLDKPIEKVPQEAINAILYGITDVTKEKRAGVTIEKRIEFDGIVKHIENIYNHDLMSMQKWALQFMNRQICPECNGTRLNKISLHFKIDEKNIAEIAAMQISDLYEWLLQVPTRLNDYQLKIGTEILRELSTKVQFLLDVGLHYLSLNRESTGLSGGEAQRIRLATQIGSKLVNVLYILDEPSIGLHQRDNRKLISSLKQLRDMGNTVIVVEHDEEMMREADYIIDLGPGAGENGGKITAAGYLDDFLQQKTITTDYLNGIRKIETPTQIRKGNGKTLTLKGATGNNLKNITLQLPLGKFICIAGVSGSGKSSLITQTLRPALSKILHHSNTYPLPYISIEGIQYIDKMIEVDQQPIGRTPRSNPATYVGFFDEIRTLYASLPEAKIRGYKPGQFSFNVKGGRCEKCGGAGVETIEMNFLPDVYVTCEECYGKRYNPETLEIRYRGKSINDVLEMSIGQAEVFFENIPSLACKIHTLNEVGLGYISLGQAATTLSGGEAQRIKLASELIKKNTGRTLYILDEPTTGLHFEDIRLLLDVLQKLVNAGNTVVVIEHNLDVIKCADHIIDLGPEGGKDGGYIIAQGTPQEIAENPNSITGKYLKV